MVSIVSKFWHAHPFSSELGMTRCSTLAHSTLLSRFLHLNLDP